MMTTRITVDDLAWWLDFAAAREWTFATTYARTAPHDYIVRERTPGVTHDDIVRAARVIHTFGAPGKYYSRTKIYLTSPDGAVRWWTEDRHFTDATLVNRSTTDLCYGIQNAPSTATDVVSAYDEVATTWDEEHPVDRLEAERVRRMLASREGPFPPQVLDLGCGTGRVLDMGLASPDRYAGVDASRAMLNVLVRKHPHVAAIYPMDAGMAVDSGMFTPGQFDWVFLDSRVPVTAAHRAKLARIARRALVHVEARKCTLDPAAEPATESPCAIGSLHD